MKVEVSFGKKSEVLLRKRDESTAARFKVAFLMQFDTCRTQPSAWRLYVDKVG